MKHEAIVDRLVLEAQGDTNVLGFLLFGSVAAGTHRESSDIDVITIRESGKPSSGIVNTLSDGIKVGNLFFSYQVLASSAEKVPYLLHPVTQAKLLFDRNASIKPLLDRIASYYSENPAIVDEWDQYYRLNKAEKAEFGYEKTTIVDVWNELEKSHSGGKIKREFFNAFYMTNPWLFSIVKKLLMAFDPPPGGGKPTGQPRP